VPAPGETVPAGEVQFEVLTVTGRRIRKVRARRLPPEHDDPARQGADGDSAPAPKENPPHD